MFQNFDRISIYYNFEIILLNQYIDESNIWKKNINKLSIKNK